MNVVLHGAVVMGAVLVSRRVVQHIWWATAQGVARTKFKSDGRGRRDVSTSGTFGMDRRLQAKNEREGTMGCDANESILTMWVSVSAAVFGCHPMRVEVVAWASCMPYLLAAILLGKQVMDGGLEFHKSPDLRWVQTIQRRGERMGSYCTSRKSWME